jgi:hypothetical protein
MSKWGLRKRAARTYQRIGGSDVVKRRVVMTEFAQKHDLLYFHTVSSDNESAPIIRGTTTSPKQVDSNFSIGTHAGYDMALIERASDVEFIGFESSYHRWYVLQIDLKHARNVPFIFLGTQQLTKAFYAKVLTSHRDIRYLQLESQSLSHAAFHGHYAIIASPSTYSLLHEIFDEEAITMIATHKRPFSVEIENDSLILFTEAEKASEQLLDKLLHYGLWLAKRIDERVV